MSAKLQCEICGGKLIGKPGGIFECEICGTEYSTEWARAKLQELSGVVRLGETESTPKTVSDWPTVSADTRKKENLLKLGIMALADGEWDKARKYYEQVFIYDAECAETYLGIMLADNKLHSTADIGKLDTKYSIDSLTLSPSYKRFFQYATPEQKQEVIRLLEIASKNADEAIRRRQAFLEQLDKDELLPAAVDAILETGIASVSVLQRVLKIGYARAARIIDEMEKKDIVGPFDGSTMRKINITKEQWKVMKHSAE